MKPKTIAAYFSHRDELPHHALLFSNPHLGEGGLTSSEMQCLASSQCGIEVTQTHSDIDFWESLQRNPNVSLLNRDSKELKKDDIEPLREVVLYPPQGARKRLIYIERCERLNPYAANSLLKTLEEPSAQVLFILTCSHLSRLLPTVKSRCLHLPFQTEKPRIHSFSEENMDEKQQQWSRFLDDLLQNPTLAPMERIAQTLSQFDKSGKAFTDDQHINLIMQKSTQAFYEDKISADSFRSLKQSLRKWRDSLPFHPSPLLHLTRIALLFQK